jgi:hypothetical protein
LEEVVKELVCEIRESDLDGRGELKEEYSRMFLTTAELNCGGIRRLLSWPQDGGQDD